MRRSQYEKAEGLDHKFIRLASGRLITFWDSIRMVDAAINQLGRELSRAFKLASSEYDLESVEQRLDRIEERHRALREHLKRLRAVEAQRVKIAALRNTAGRTPEEAAAFLRKADELESQLPT
jgi:hypothetical protein